LISSTSSCKESSPGALRCRQFAVPFFISGEENAEFRSPWSISGDPDHTNIFLVR
jgi:hypothetical protein